MTESERKRRNRRDSLSATVSMIAFFAISFILAFLTLFQKNFGQIDICRLGSGAFVVIGAFLTLKYIFGKGYMQFHDYSFSAGVLLIILGICGMIRAYELAAVSDQLFSLMTLVTGIYFLQCMIQFIKLGSGFWIAEMIAGILAVSASVIGLLDARMVLERIYMFINWALLISSALAVLSVILSLFLVRGFRRRLEKAAEEALKKQEEQKKAEEAVSEAPPVPAEAEPVPEEAPVSAVFLEADETIPEKPEEENTSEGI
ncbi:MAG: hypothetical protein K6A40_02470 [Solobacterium sp.]|nr:hypothetical protein [Solobacterium sp.]